MHRLTRDDIEQAAHHVYQVMPATAQYPWPLLAERLGCTVWVKHENHTPTGAFKVRGGITFIHWLKREHPGIKGIVTATRGNHGQSLALAAGALGLRALIVVPEGNSVEKNNAMRAFGGEVVECGRDFDEACEEAARLAQAHDLYGLVFGIGLWGVVNLGIKSGLSAGIASLVLQFSAFFTILLGSWIFKETISRFQYAGMGLALCGLLSIISIVDGTVTTAGLILVLLGAVAWSAANVINKKAKTTQVFAFLVWSSAFSPIPLFVLDYTVNGSTGYSALVNQLDYRAVLSILFQVYPNTLFGYWVWNSLLKRYPVSTVAPLSLLVPVFGLLGSITIFNENLSVNKMVAVVLIVSGLGVGLYGQRVLSAVLKRSDRCPS